MRKSFVWVLISMVVAFGMFACGETSSTNDAGSEENTTSPLKGSWYYHDAQPADAVITFIDNETFIFEQNGGDVMSGQTGIERGSYTWSSTSFKPTITTDTNGNWGFSDQTGLDVPYTISGNVLTVNGSASFTKITSSAGNPLIGSWYYKDSQPSYAVLTFIDDSNFMFAQVGGSECGQAGMEQGTYVSSTSSFTPTVVTDTNGCWGFSDQSGTAALISISGNALTINGNAVFTRVQ